MSGKAWYEPAASPREITLWVADVSGCADARKRASKAGMTKRLFTVRLMLWLVRQNPDLLPGQRARPKAGFLELAVEMMDDLAAVSLGPNEQRIVVFH